MKITKILLTLSIIAIPVYIIAVLLIPEYSIFSIKNIYFILPLIIIYSICYSLLKKKIPIYLSYLMFWQNIHLLWFNKKSERYSFSLGSFLISTGYLFITLIFFFYVSFRDSYVFFIGCIVLLVIMGIQIRVILPFIKQDFSKNVRLLNDSIQINNEKISIQNIEKIIFYKYESVELFGPRLNDLSNFYYIKIVTNDEFYLLSSFLGYSLYNDIRRKYPTIEYEEKRDFFSYKK